MMTMNPGVWMSFHGGGAALILGTPAGRHCAVGSSFECEPLLRSSNSALAQAWNGTSSGFRSAARFCTYLPLGSQIPDRSGRPSASRGAGAARFGLPSDVRGIARAGTFSHWAPAGWHIKESTIKPRGNTFLETTDQTTKFLVENDLVIRPFRQWVAFTSSSHIAQQTFDI